MTKAIRAWMTTEPELGSAMDTLRIATIGHLPDKREEVDTSFPFEGFGLVLSGRGWIRVGDGRVRELRAPAVFYIWPGPRFRYGPAEGTSWEERFLCVSGARVADWRRWRWLPRPRVPLPLQTATARSLARAHERVGAALRRGAGGGAETDAAKLDAERLVWALHRETAPEAAPAPDALDELLARWRQHPAATANLRRCAQELEMSYSGFRRKLRERTGLSAYQYLLRARLDEACRTLLETDRPVKAVAYAAGFAGVESFCRAFRRVKGAAPSRFRQGHRAMGDAK